MSNKKSIAELEEAALKAEQRAKALRDKAKRQTQMEEAKLNVAIIEAVELWNSTRPNSVNKNELPRLFTEWAEKNKLKYENS